MKFKMNVEKKPGNKKGFIMNKETKKKISEAYWNNYDERIKKARKRKGL